MGAWGTGSFQNDNALDWLASFDETGNDWGMVRALLVEFLKASRADAIASTCCEVLAAAECVAAALGHPADDIPDEIAIRCGSSIASLPKDLPSLAADAVALIRKDSELRELWMESTGSLGEWNQVISSLLMRLETGKGS